jgi:hypothetical protein
MGDYLAAQALTIAPGRNYAQSEAPKKIIGSIFGASRRDVEDVDGPEEEVRRFPGSRTQTLQALGVVRGYCAMKPAEKDEEGGKKSVSAQPDGPGGGARLWG